MKFCALASLGLWRARTYPTHPAPKLSTMLSCQDLSFAGGQRYDFSVSTSVDGSVDVSTATLVSLWDAGPLDNAARQHEPPRRDALPVSEHGLGHRPTWPDQLSPQLQRNKQLQDTLMQREEELARLQEENNKLKEFLNSSYVKSLEEKTKKLLSNCKVPDGSGHRKRTHGDFRNLSQLLHNGEGKRTCRNLSLEFCSAEELVATPPLDSWILETLGLQDENTIDPESSFSTPSFSCPLPTEDPYSTTNVEYNNIVDSSSNCSLDTSSGYSTSQSLGSDYSTLDPSALYTIASKGSLVSSPSSMTTTQHFTPPRAASTPYRPQDVSPGPYYNTPACGSSSPPGGDSLLFSTPRMSRSRTDLAFSMSLSPQNSVKTHSFPQGQAFTRRDAQGGWNFTWVPKQCS
ncbi:geminin coiled-coil domain-containing protein 1 isoform X1 [Carassius auratus]|uniref:Geminin coiled-coil domain-containing protein 1 isoform X1 n=2 Tax=Carassius auratus TaxID=7957 RepID=A0A6P6QXE9_CARAU|nr:geminin coiled-coil domain-containing protein 1-like isoform X1 [Carassius auratus]